MFKVKPYNSANGHRNSCGKVDKWKILEKLNFLQGTILHKTLNSSIGKKMIIYSAHFSTIGLHEQPRSVLCFNAKPGHDKDQKPRYIFRYFWTPHVIITSPLRWLFGVVDENTLQKRGADRRAKETKIERIKTKATPIPPHLLNCLWDRTHWRLAMMLKAVSMWFHHKDFSNKTWPAAIAFLEIIYFSDAE